MPSQEELQHALASFKGEIEQLPPMHSAIKVGGKKLYELARAGIEIDRKTRRVTITELDLLNYEPPTLNIHVECSKGTYIRSLAHDLGQSLGTGAYLQALARTRHGPFTLEGSISLEALQASFDAGNPEAHLYPPEYILAGWDTYQTTEQEELSIRQGKPLALPAPAPAKRQLLVANTPSGKLLAMLYWNAESQLWRPKKVFNPDE